MSSTLHRLRPIEKFGYSLGDVAANLVARGVLAFLTVFYTDTFGLETLAVAALLLVVRLSDGVTDIIMGMIADRTNSRWGKFRPWILFSAPFLALFMILTYTTPDLSPTGKLIYAYITYIGLTLAYTMNNVPYSSLMGVMTPSHEERTNLSSWRFAGAFSGGFLILVGTPLLIGFLGKGNEQLGYQYTMYVFAVLLLILMTLTFFLTTERVASPAVSIDDNTSWGSFALNMCVASIPLIAMSVFFYYRNLLTGVIFVVVIAAASFLIKKLIRKPDAEKSGAEKDIVDLLTNRPWVTILGVGFLFMMFNGIKLGAAAYYFKHYLNDGISIVQFLPWWPTSIINIEGKEAFLSAYFAALLSVSIVAAFSTGYLVKIFGKKGLFIISLVLGGVLTSAIYLLKQEDMGLLFLLGVVSEFFSAILPVLFFAMLGDTADFSEWKNGRRATGLIYSAGTFVNKTGGGFAGALIVIVLAAYGYQGGDASTIHLALPALKSLMSWIPGLFAIVAAGFMVIYPLSHAKMTEVEAGLAAKRHNTNE